MKQLHGSLETAPLVLPVQGWRGYDVYRFWGFHGCSGWWIRHAPVGGFRGGAFLLLGHLTDAAQVQAAISVLYQSVGYGCKRQNCPGRIIQRGKSLKSAFPPSLKHHFPEQVFAFAAQQCRVNCGAGASACQLCMLPAWQRSSARLAGESACPT
jgi:hypothetical protein